MICATLQAAIPQQVTFNPNNKDHMEAFRLLVIGDSKGVIRQHPSLRFHLEEQFKDIRTMMIHKVGMAHYDLVKAM